MEYADLLEILKFDSKAGLFYWKKQSGYSKPGDVAGAKRSDGYMGFSIGRKRFLSHRVAWLFVHGVWPKGQIDHINGIRTDNRILNLRDVDHDTNLQNRRSAQKNNKTGFLGVSPRKNGFDARIQVGGKKIHLGSFGTPEEAFSAYRQAKRNYHKGCTL